MPNSNKKKGLTGFDRFQLFPLEKNDISNYEVGTNFSLPYVQKMTKDPDVAEQKTYADDGLYLNVTNFNGLTAEIDTAQMTLPLWARLGFGAYDPDTGEFEWDPQGKNLEFGATFRCQTADGEYRMYRMYRLIISSVIESETTTKGDSANVQPYKVKGTFAKRAVDGNIGMAKDGTKDDVAWLDVIPAIAP